ncbi:MAG: purine-binding chemotaxis protein CheW [FCB group bacterium]|nr:purine-binding chemotaxis protein CheW [FCB group bacterium]
MTNEQQILEVPNGAETAVEIRAGKYLTFCLGAEEYGLAILRVREIIGLMAITNVPRTPHHIRGVINLRGKVIPVLNLRAKFGMETKEDTEETCIIVVESSIQGSPVQIGILVDAVSEVLDIEESDIEDAPVIGNNFNGDFIIGLAKTKDGVKILLDIDQVLSASDVEIAQNMDQKPEEATKEQEYAEEIQ